MKTTCGQYVIHALERSGITHAFGIPGVHNLELYRGVAASGMVHVTPHHEQGAAFMADGYARLSGRPALVLPITGPGVLNAATGIAQAYSDSVPMLVVATTNPLDTQGAGLGELHETLDQRRVMEGILEDVFVLRSAESLPRLLRMVLERLASGRPRPVYLELPVDLAGRTHDFPDFVAIPDPRPRAATDEAVRHLAGMLSAAARPAFLLGAGASGAAPGLRDLVCRTGAMVVSSIAGKGIVADDAPGSLGARLDDAGVQDAIAASDLVLSLGTELAMTDRYSPLPAFSGAHIRIDIDPRQFARGPVPDFVIEADAGQVVEALLDLLPAQRKPCWHEGIDALRATAMANTQIARSLAALRRGVPDDGVVLTDMTQIAYAGGALYPARRARGWIHPAGYGTLGYALPAAIGAVLAEPKSCIVALAGDYGFGFSGTELATAARLGIALPVVIWNNGRLGQIQDDMDGLNIPRTGVEVAPLDFAAFATAHGADYALCPQEDDLPDLIARARKATGPTLIEIRERD